MAFYNPGMEDDSHPDAWAVVGLLVVGIVLIVVGFVDILGSTGAGVPSLGPLSMALIVIGALCFSGGAIFIAAKKKSSR